MNNRDLLELLENILELLSESPIALGLSLPLCVLAWKFPEIIRAFGHEIRESRKNTLEVAHRQAVLRKRLENSKQRRTGAKK
jgi:hypothetical protein